MRGNALGLHWHSQPSGCGLGQEPKNVMLFGPCGAGIHRPLHWCLSPGMLEVCQMNTWHRLWCQKWNSERVRIHPSHCTISWPTYPISYLPSLPPSSSSLSFPPNFLSFLFTSLPPSLPPFFPPLLPPLLPSLLPSFLHSFLFTLPLFFPPSPSFSSFFCSFFLFFLFYVPKHEMALTTNPGIKLGRTKDHHLLCPWPI